MIIFFPSQCKLSSPEKFPTHRETSNKPGSFFSTASGCFLATRKPPLTFPSSTGTFLPSTKIYSPGKLPYYQDSYQWEAPYPLGTFLPIKKLSSHQEASFPPRSFPSTVKLPFHLDSRSPLFPPNLLSIRKFFLICSLLLTEDFPSH